MTHVFRIQDLDGRGPFKPGYTETWLIDRPELDDLKPFSVLEIYGLYSKNMFSGARFIGFGCRSIEQLKKWFIEEEYKTLLKRGYSAVEMLIDDVLLENENQVLFARQRPLNKALKKFELY
ncbi:MAG: hypothetical protein AB1403_00605 [Candidatus Riflebacteria bacterium]